MKIQRFIAALGVVGLAFGGSAYAGQYDAESLGQALPMWMETLASINDHGDVAWTAWDGSSTSAEFFGDGTPHTLQSTAGESWAVSVTRRVADGDTQVVGIAGSEASSQRLTDRSALLWDVRWEDNTTPTSTIIDLGAATDKLDANQEGTVQQSAAYGVVEKSGSANRYYVGGFARDKVHKNVLPKPVIWDVESANSNSPNIEVTVLDTLANTDTATGYVSSIARDDNNIWACGNSTDSGAYNQATCWDLSDGPGAASANGQLVHDLTSSSVFGANVISSMVHRVRYVPVGEDGALEPVAVGSALVGSGGNAQWKGFAYNLSSGDTWTDLNLTDENETMAYDVAALTYEGYDDDVSAKVVSHGLQIAGISSTADSAAFGGLEGGPLGADANKMTGIERRALTSGITDEGQVCRIQDDSEDVGNYEQLLALSSDGTYRLAMSEGELVRLLAMPTDASLEVRNRDASKRERHFESRDPLQYFQVQATLNKPAEAAIVRFANAIGCGALDENDLGACDESVAFDINSDQDELNVLLEQMIGVAQPSSTLRGAKEEGLFDPAEYVYAQIAQRSPDECIITPVYASTVDEIEVITNPSQDFDGKEWEACSDGYVDTQVDYEHCGACETLAEVNGTGLHNDRALSQCVYGQCIGGTPQVESDETQLHKANTCYIDSTCYEPNEARPIDSGAENAVNFCQECQPAHSQAAWETYPNSTCCDANAEPVISGWHKGYRPENDNISYNGSTLTSDWIQRIAEVSDGGYWDEWYRNWIGICNEYRCSRTGSAHRVQRLTSFISQADPEDWFVFRHSDKNERGSKMSYPRIRVKPQTNTKVELCVYPRCFDNINTSQKHAWAESLMSSISGTNHGRTRALAGTTPVYIPPSNSPIKEDGVGLAGACTSSQTESGAADLLMIVEDYNKNEAPSACWNADYFVQVKFKEGDPPRTCEDNYKMLWGNWMTEGCANDYGPDYMRDNYSSYLDYCDNSGSPNDHYP